MVAADIAPIGRGSVSPDVQFIRRPSAGRTILDGRNGARRFRRRRQHCPYLRNAAITSGPYTGSRGFRCWLGVVASGLSGGSCGRGHGHPVTAHSSFRIVASRLWTLFGSGG